MSEVPGQRLFEERLRERYGQYYELARRLDALAGDMAESRPVLFRTAFDGLSSFFFSRSSKTFSAILILCQRGFGEDAAVLCRSLVENVVNFLYIRQDPAERADLYLEYEYVLRHTYVEMLAATGSLDGLAVRDENARKELRELYESVKKRYPNRHLWSGKSLRVMADDVGLSAHYRFAYKYFSDLAHGAPSVIMGLLCPAEEPGFVRIDFGPTESFIREATIWSCDLFWRVLVTYNDIFSLGMEAQLDELSTRMREVFGGEAR